MLLLLAVRIALVLLTSTAAHSAFRYTCTMFGVSVQYFHTYFLYSLILFKRATSDIEGRGLRCETSLRPKLFITDRSKVVVLMWFFVACFYRR